MKASGFGVAYKDVELQNYCANFVYEGQYCLRKRVVSVYRRSSMDILDYGVAFLMCRLIPIEE